MKVYLVWEDFGRSTHANVHGVYATREGAQEALKDLRDSVTGHRHEYSMQTREVLVK